MKKREKKLQLNRETVLRLDDKKLREAGGAVAADWTSCIEPNCCGFETIQNGVG